MPDETHAVAGQPQAQSPAITLSRALPSLLALGVADLLPLWGVYRLDWSVLAVAYVYVISTVAAGVLGRRRAKLARGEGSTDDATLISEFFKTYMTVVIAAALIASMVFTGRLLKPSGGVPDNVFAAFSTWQFWVVAAAGVGAQLVAYAWDFIHSGERDLLPPEAFVSEPLRRLFVLQGVVMVLGLLVFWRGSATNGLAAVVVIEAAAEVGLAAMARQRVARIRAALAAGEVVARLARPKERPRGGRKRRRR